MGTDRKSIDLQVQEQPQLKEDGTEGEEANGDDIKVENCDSPLENIGGLEIKLVTSVESNDFTIKEIPIDGQVEESSDESFPTTVITDDAARPIVDGINGNESLKLSFEQTTTMYNLENGKGLIWAPYSEIRRHYMNNHLWKEQKFESLSHHSAESVAHKLIADEGSRLDILLDADDYIVSNHEEEFSSIIACALTLLKNPPTASDELVEDANSN
ncbi:1-phosphatidylinositol-3-phosphate 5-kinase [Abeliophyllum distichum]|uniref:1-phosphatidylinositol-3-phosphate 5-kinase n=1 Tax=Abeliophyllum distichum TaxID=126358 RepID=A0ABD1PUX6_9LAMI